MAEAAAQAGNQSINQSSRHRHCELLERDRVAAEQQSVAAAAGNTVVL